MAVYVHSGGTTNGILQANGSHASEIDSTAPNIQKGKVPGNQNVDDLSNSYTVANGYNYGVFGPFTIESGITLTVSTGGTFTVV